MARVVTFLADGFEEVEAITPVDFLRRAGIDVTVAGVGGSAPTGARGVHVTTDVNVADVSGDFDGVILPGGMPGAANLAASADVERLCRETWENGGLVAAICAAPAVALHRFGLLKGRRFTCYPGFQDEVDGAVFSDDRVVIDGNLITSRGPGTAGAFALELVRYFVGDDAAGKLEKQTLLNDSGT